MERNQHHPDPRPLVQHLPRQQLGRRRLPLELSVRLGSHLLRRLPQLLRQCGLDAVVAAFAVMVSQLQQDRFERPQDFEAEPRVMVGDGVGEGVDPGCEGEGGRGGGEQGGEDGVACVAYSCL